jgi:hypothetical protein
VQEEIAQAIVQSLRQNPGPSGTLPLVRRTTQNLEAYNLYLQGRYHRSKVFGNAIERAIGLFQHAIKKDPRFAAAYAELAYCYIHSQTKPRKG